MKLPDVTLAVPPDEFAKLAPTLRELGYEERAVAELLGVWDISEIKVEHLAHYSWRCKKAHTKLSTLVSLFLLGEGIGKAALLQLLGQDNVRTLMHCGVLIGFSGVFSSQVVLYPCLGHFVFTDYWFSAGEQTEGKIYELGTDSYVLARVTPRPRVKSALDLCTGSGIHAIMSKTFADRSVAVDINPRAIEFTKLNAALNSVGCEPLLGDLYQPLGEQRFDLITVNPPFVPSPDPQVLIHRSPGKSGEEVSQRIVEELPRRLERGGLFSMVLEYPVFDSDEYQDRLERWLKQKNGWGIAILSFFRRPIQDYIEAHLVRNESYNEKFSHYLDSYAEQGIQAVEFANVFIKRIDENSPNWKAKEKAIRPNLSITPEISDWLDCLTVYSDPTWQPPDDWKPALNHYYRALWRDWDHQRGVLEPNPDNCLASEPLDEHQSELMGRMQSGRSSVGQLRTQWLSDGLEKTAFDRSLRELALRRCLAFKR